MPILKTNKLDILKQAGQVFRVRGYHATSMSDLEKALNIKKATLYHYFKGGKEELMQAILQLTLSYFQERIWPVLRDKNRTAAERYTFAAGKLYRFFTRQKGGCIMGNTSLECGHLDPVPSFMGEVKTYFDDSLAAMNHLYSQVLSEKEADEQAKHFVQDLEGGIMLMRVYDDPHFLEEALKRGGIPFGLDLSFPLPKPEDKPS